MQSRDRHSAHMLLSSSTSGVITKENKINFMEGRTHMQIHVYTAVHKINNNNNYGYLAPNKMLLVFVKSIPMCSLLISSTKKIEIGV